MHNNTWINKVLHYDIKYNVLNDFYNDFNALGIGWLDEHNDYEGDGGIYSRTISNSGGIWNGGKSFVLYFANEENRILCKIALSKYIEENEYG